ncbi:hypothetical protein Pfo_020755 [Paulownia fortunei]|nr:hypothetical protein Pfo_020755 [Paulownia fortunei]
MGSIDGYSERLKPSSQKKSTTLTLFEDLLHGSNTENLHSGTNFEDEYQGDSCPSDCESGISGTENEQKFRLSDNGLIRICDGEMIYEIIKKKLVSSLSSCGFNAQVEAIHRKDYSGIMSRAKFQSFCIYSRAMEMKCGGNANVRYAWYGASKNEINRILSHGFGLPTNTPTHGQGIYLSPVDHPVESIGKMEIICPGSGQYNPSSEEFDSGVDNLVSPQNYIVWSSRMNTHILPEFVVSFRASSNCRGCQRSLQPSRLPNSDWMPFPTLITTLSKFLPPDALELIVKHHSDYKKQKITRFEMIQRVRHIAGDKLLMAIIKSYRGKNWNRTFTCFSNMLQ